MLLKNRKFEKSYLLFLQLRNMLCERFIDLLELNYTQNISLNKHFQVHLKIELCMYEYTFFVSFKT